MTAAKVAIDRILIGLCFAGLVLDHGAVMTSLGSALLVVFGTVGLTVAWLNRARAEE